MVNTNTYEILNTMAKLHKSGDEFKHITLKELNDYLSRPTDENCMINLEQSNFFTYTYKKEGEVSVPAYILLPAGYDYLDKLKSEKRNLRYLRITILITSLALIVSVLALLIQVGILPI